MLPKIFGPLELQLSVTLLLIDQESGCGKRDERGLSHLDCIWVPLVIRTLPPVENHGFMARTLSKDAKVWAWRWWVGANDVRRLQVKQLGTFGVNVRQFDLNKLVVCLLGHFACVFVKTCCRQFFY